MPSIFRRSKANQYKDNKSSGFAGIFRADSLQLRLVLFIAMSAIFFLFLKITERKIPHGLAPDSTEDTTAVSAPATPPTTRVPVLPPTRSK
ncbi:MAG TPA: hypothetical protein VG537_08530 [Candidatus Kapabacteria bacterium]|nr:hypothetical protein [Candidatus Kapabacteria bacterium]